MHGKIQYAVLNIVFHTGITVYSKLAFNLLIQQNSFNLDISHTSIEILSLIICRCVKRFKLSHDIDSIS